MKDFDGLTYTRDALAEELSLVERHSRDGSAIEGGCSCIEEKHLLLIAGLASEGVTLASDPAEKNYYFNLAQWARTKRTEILDGKFKVPGNPATREYLPHSLTKCERHNASVQHKLSSCIEQAEISCCGEHTADYGGCTCNPVAVCRASIHCP